MRDIMKAVVQNECAKFQCHMGSIKTSQLEHSTVVLTLDTYFHVLQMCQQGALCEAAVGVKSFYLRCRLATSTPIPYSEFLSPLCPRSQVGE
jgi:hypothetical protein